VPMNKPFWPVKAPCPDEDHRLKAHVIRCVVGSEPINVDEGCTRTMVCNVSFSSFLAAHFG